MPISRAQRWSRTALGQIDELGKAAVPPSCPVPPSCRATSEVADKWLQCSSDSAVGFGLASVYCKDAWYNREERVGSLLLLLHEN